MQNRFLRHQARFAGVCFALAWLGAAWPALGYEPPVEEIVSRATQMDSQVSRAIVHLTTRVFDPMGETQDGEGKDSALASSREAVPMEIPDAEFLQVIYWIRGSFLAIETFSAKGELLHFWLDEYFRPVSKGVSDSRRFTDWDILHPFLPFAGKTPEEWLKGLAEWGVYPERVKLVRSPKGEILYQLLGSSGQSVWVEREYFHPVRIKVWVGSGEKPTLMEIEFSEFTFYGDSGQDSQNLAFPRTMNLTINGRLAKQTVVTGFEPNPNWRKFPLSRLRKKAAELSPPPALTLARKEAP